MNKKIIIGVAAFSLLALGATSIVFAAGANFQTWREVMGGRGRASQVVTEANFDRFTSMHRNIADGNYAEAQKIRTELGLGQGQPGGRGGRGGCPMHQGQGADCAMRGTGSSTANFIDQNNNGICDHME